jgi:hypothetical protein
LPGFVADFLAWPHLSQPIAQGRRFESFGRSYVRNPQKQHYLFETA